MNIVEINHLSKAFGEHSILKDVTFAVPEGSIFGFLGENGAGKTTTMKILLGLLKSDSGDITVCGKKVTYGQNETNRYIGYLADVPAFYGYMKPIEYLRLCGEITGMKRAACETRSKELLELVGLASQNKRIGGFSRGMKQRLGIAQALLNEPKLLVCDEPTSALDPVGRKEILDLMQMVKQHTTVIFSTHILSDVERICDNIALLHDGQIKLQGDLNQIKEQQSSSVIELDIREDVSHALKNGQTPDITSFLASLTAQNYMVDDDYEDNIHHLHINVSDYAHDGENILTLCTYNHVVPQRFQLAEPTLENLFMEVVQK